MSTVQAIKAVLFYLLLSASALVWGALSFFITPTPPLHARCRFVVQNWCRFMIQLARAVAGTHYKMRGLENTPKKPCVTFSKHQSVWEIFFLFGFFEPLSQVLKCELLCASFFGWALALLKSIAADRSQPKLVLKQLVRQGDGYLKRGARVLIFPGSTRTPMRQMGKFSHGDTALAVNAGLSVLLIAHNAGQYWPKIGWVKYLGTIQIVVGPAMRAEGEGLRAIAEPNQRTETWASETMAETNPIQQRISHLELSMVLRRAAKPPARRTMRRFDKRSSVITGLLAFTRGAK